MAVPKRKKSKSKIRSRVRSHKAQVVNTGACPECGAAQEPHRVCPACGYYRGRQVLTIKAD
jgi:large subunit ribosomal protein L32